MTGKHAYIRNEGRFLIASQKRPRDIADGVELPKNMDRGLAKKCDMYAYCMS